MNHHHKNAAHKKGFERKKLANGQPNPRYVDLLLEDKPIAGQHWACMSFVTPTKILKKKEIFFFEQFLKKWELNKSMEKFVQFINFVSYKYNIKSEEVMEEFKEFVESERATLTKSCEDDYKTFLDKNEERLEKIYSEENKCQTSVRGIKVRGTFPTQQEAELRCKMLREVDPNHDVYVGPVGIWMPFHPEAYKTGNVQYLEKELNELMHEKKKNDDYSKSEFDKRIKESKVNAIQENIEKAKEHNNRLTQTINENGELVSIQNMNTQEKNLGVNATLDEIKKELFEGENIVVGKSDHGLNEILKKYNS
jgi:hypothetical protein